MASEERRTVRAALVERPGVLVVRQVPLPPVGEYDALCQLLYGATCSGTDQHLIAGRFPWPVRYPTILGHESIGRVVEVGSRVRNYRPGDLITRVGMLPAPDGEFDVNWGGFAEVGIARDHWAMEEDGLPPEKWRRFRVNQVLPPGTDPAAATMVITWRETLSYVTRMGIDAGASLLVVGSGGNGLSFVSHAVNLGASCVAMVGHLQRRDVALKAGAAAYFDYKTQDLSDRIAAHPSVSDAAPEGFDHIIDAVGKADTLDTVLPLLKRGGTVGIYGIDDYGQCLIHPQRAQGTFTYYSGGYEEAETHARAVSMMGRGELRAGLWLDLEHPFSLDEIGEAIQAVRDRRVVKALVKLSTA